MTKCIFQSYYFVVIPSGFYFKACFISKNIFKNHLYMKTYLIVPLPVWNVLSKLNQIYIYSLLLRLCFNIAFWSLTHRCLFCWHMTCPLLQAFFLLTQKLILIVFEGWVSMTQGLFEWLTTDATRLKLLFSSHICIAISTLSR